MIRKAELKDVIRKQQEIVKLQEQIEKIDLQIKEAEKLGIKEN